MTGYSKKELKTLNKIARDLFGCDFEELDPEDQSDVYCYAEEHEML